MYMHACLNSMQNEVLNELVSQYLATAPKRDAEVKLWKDLVTRYQKVDKFFEKFACLLFALLRYHSSNIHLFLK